MSTPMTLRSNSMVNRATPADRSKLPPGTTRGNCPVLASYHVKQITFRGDINLTPLAL